MTVTLQDVLGRLDAVKRSGAGYTSRCPAHDDRQASLKIEAGDDVPVVLYCFAGCEFKSIERALGFEAGDLSRTEEGRTTGRQIVATYVYRNADGTTFARKERYISDTGAKTFLWSRPDGERWTPGTKGYIPLYRLPELVGAPATETVLIVEGEKDCDRLASLGYVVTTTPNGAGARWRAEDSDAFAGRKVCVIADDDEAGRKKAADTADALRDVAAAVGVVRLPNPNRIKGFDASDFLDSGGTVADLNRAIVAAFEGTTPAEVVTFDVLTERVLQLYDKGDEPGVYPGWKKLAPLYRPRLGEMTILTGAPGSGKSTFLDDLAVRIACGDESQDGQRAAGWKFLFFSAEQFPPERHASRLLQKIIGRPFADGPTPRMSRSQVAVGLDLLRQHFTILDPSLNSCTLDRILEVAHELNAKRGLNGLVLDPFNVLAATSRTK